jgi:hypothetical protein
LELLPAHLTDKFFVLGEKPESLQKFPTKGIWKDLLAIRTIFFSKCPIGPMTIALVHHLPMIVNDSSVDIIIFIEKKINYKSFIKEDIK